MAGMAARPYLWTSIGGMSVSTAAYMVYKNLSLKTLLGLAQPGGKWRLLAIIFALLNLKSLPLAWHARVFYGLLRHIFLFKNRAPPPYPPGSLFQPVITSTHCSLLEMDYNFHKSNSTYFQDLDVSRMHHLACLMRLGLHRAHFRNAPDRPNEWDEGKFRIMFGGVTCTFKKEIQPYQSYEIWTRVLSWDQKWLYLVCHIVKKGAVKPKGYTLQPGRKKVKSTDNFSDHANGSANGFINEGKETHPAVLAVSVAKYVFKRGRKTIPPENALRVAELLPPRPENASEPLKDLSTSSGSDTPAIDETATENVVVEAVSKVIPDEEVLGPKLEVNFGQWTWEAVEAERERGMQIARHMVGLDKALSVWTADEQPALGEF